MQPQQPFDDLAPQVVLGIAAHPDDLDFSSGGTLAYFARHGAAVHYLQLTDGCKGTADPTISSAQLTKIRQQEQRDACDIIGGKGVQFLKHCDGELQVTLQLKAEIVKAIRQLKPDVVITTDPTMVYSSQYGIVNHPDHRAAGQAVLDAVYPLARDHLSYPELGDEGLKPHKVATVLLVNFDTHNYYVDISDNLETKLAAVKAHHSQLTEPEAMLAMFTNMAAQAGEEAGCRFAESFIRIDVGA